MHPRIVLLDGFTTTQAPIDAPDPVTPDGEPTWQPLAALGELVVHDRTPPDQLLERIGDAPIVLTNKTVLDRQTIEALPSLRYIGVMATGVNVVDLDAAREAGVVVTNVPAYGGRSVAQHVVALLLELVNHVAAHDQAVREGQWQRCPDFSFTVAPMTELAGKVLGVVGPGDIGSRVAAIGEALGMSVLVYGRRRRSLYTPVEWASLDKLFAWSDVISLHCPLTEETEGLVSAERIRQMKPTALLINTARGPLVDEAALAEALQEGRLGGAGLDVLSVEPPRAGSPLLSAPRCVITPHVAWATREARRRLIRTVADNVAAFLNGSPIHVVNA